MNAELSRRHFLQGTGALVVSFSASSLLEPFALVPFANAQGPFATHASHIDPTKLDSWLAVAADGTVTAYTGKCDLGQGMFTVQTQLVAEELCVALDKIKLIQCDTSITPDQGTTSGSQSTPTNFNSENLAQAAATAREALLAMAAQRFSVPADQLTISEGVITSPHGSHVTYHELIGGNHFDLKLSPTAKRRLPRQWTVLGQPTPSMDRVPLMTGTFEFVHNIHVPGMVHGRVVRPPAARSYRRECRREICAAHSRSHQSRRPQKLRRRRRRKTMAGHPSRERTQSLLAPRTHSSRTKRFLRLHPQAALAPGLARRLKRRRRQTQRCLPRSQSDLLASLPGAWFCWAHPAQSPTSIPTTQPSGRPRNRSIPRAIASRSSPACRLRVCASSSCAVPAATV